MSKKKVTKKKTAKADQTEVAARRAIKGMLSNEKLMTDMVDMVYAAGDKTVEPGGHIRIPLTRKDGGPDDVLILEAQIVSQTEYEMWCEMKAIEANLKRGLQNATVIPVMMPPGKGH